MNTMSISLTLGKASSPHGANILHNERYFVSENVDRNRLGDNIAYVKQDIRVAYDELFSEALKAYNAKQNKPCRQIADYYEHIEKSDREEAFYEIVVQFGSMKTAPVGSREGEIATQMLDEYMRGFSKRNPNLHVFSGHLHVDEASPHLHIDFVPFTTKPSKYGLTKRVSMKSALDEMGFSAKNFKQNRLVAWQDSERVEMEKILNRHGLTREVKNDKSAHLEVDEFKREQELERLESLFLARTNADEIAIGDLYSTVAALEVENEKLIAEKHSPWKSFFYSDSDKQSFVIAELTRLQIPFRETGNGFEAQEVYVDEIRKIEKSYKPKENPHRETLRDLLDKSIMQSQNYDEVLERLRDSGCEVKCGKYLAVKVKWASNFIRTHQLGADYSEQAIKNRLTYKARFESDIDNKIQSADKDTPYYMMQKTVRHYTVVFAAGVLPMKRLRKKKPFSWENCEVLDKLASLNKKINEGVTLQSLRNDFVRLEKSVEDLEGTLARAKSPSSHYDDYTIREIERYLLEDQLALRDTVDTLDTLEKVMGGTYVQGLVDEEKQRAQSAYIRNGLKYADGEESKIENATTRVGNSPKR